MRLAIIKIKCFTKNRIGNNSHFKDENFKFHEECEWRFVPTRKQIGGNYISINASTHKEEKEKEKKDNKYEHKFNKRIKNHTLKFELNDIKFIYVDSENIEQLKHIHPQLTQKIKPSNWKS